VIRYFRKGKIGIRKGSDSSCVSASGKKGLVLGCYDGCNPNEVKLTTTAKRFDEETGGKLSEMLQNTEIKKGEVKVFGNLSQDFYSIAVAGAGKEGVGYNSLENLDECKENIRIAAGLGARTLQDEGIPAVYVEGFTSSESAAEGSTLATWSYQELKKRENHSIAYSKLELFASDDREGWSAGVIKAESQNIARRLEEVPANQMSPTVFAQAAIDTLCACGVQVEVRDKDWIETKKMSAFLAMAKGSCEPPLMLELGYCGSKPDDKPIVMIGKGVMFDSGGTCLKPAEGMSVHRADMAGAAVVVGVFRAIASLALPLNVVALVPLCENMPGGMAMKPGDVVLGLNGKTIRIENTDNEGRIIMADAVAYSVYNKPCLVMTVGTLTNAMKSALGTSSSGVFSTSDIAWRELSRAGSETGDRVWRFPIWKYYTTKVTDYIGVDVNNVGKGIGGDACLATAFLMEFAPPVDFVNIDITGTGMLAEGTNFPYLRKGFMTGRPVRTIAQFFYQMACPHSKGDDC